MLDIISSEFYKVRKSKVTLVTAICLMAISLLNVASLIYAKVAGGLMEQYISSTTGIETYANFCIGTLYLVFIAIFVGGMLTNEYTNGTVRQVVSRGTSRVHIAIGQYIALCTAMTVISIACAAVSGIAAGILCGWGSISVGRFLLVIFGQIVLVWSYAAITMLIAHITRSGGLAIGINIMLLLGGSMASSILFVITKKELFVNYWLVNMQYSAVDFSINLGTQVKFIVILGVLGIICMAFSVLCFKKRDVN